MTELPSTSQFSSIYQKIKNERSINNHTIDNAASKEKTYFGGGGGPTTKDTTSNSKRGNANTNANLDFDSCINDFRRLQTSKSKSDLKSRSSANKLKTRPELEHRDVYNDLSDLKARAKNKWTIPAFTRNPSNDFTDEQKHLQILDAPWVGQKQIEEQRPYYEKLHLNLKQKNTAQIIRVKDDEQLKKLIEFQIKNKAKFNSMIKVKVPDEEVSMVKVKEAPKKDEVVLESWQSSVNISRVVTPKFSSSRR